MCLPDWWKKFENNYIYSFRQNTRTWQTYTETDGQTPLNDIGRAYAYHHGHPQEFLQEREKSTSSLSSLSLSLALHYCPPSPPLSSTSLLSCPVQVGLPFLLCCRADPLNTAKRLGKRCKLPQYSGVRDSCNHNLGIFWTSKACLVATILVLFVGNKML